MKPINLNEPAYNYYKKPEKDRKIIVNCSVGGEPTIENLTSDDGRPLCRAHFDQMILKRK